MTTRLKLTTVGLLLAAAASTAHAQTNLLQAVTVGFTVYSQGTPVTTPLRTNNVVEKGFFGTKDLIKAISTSGKFHSGDILARATPVTNGTLGTASWVIYNDGAITPISTNVYFDVHTDEAYGSTNSLAYIHGETITANNVIKFGTTDEIRTLILSNSTWQIKLQGYAHGHFVPISAGGSNVVDSQDYNWSGSGSGTTTDSAVVVLQGDVTEDYFKFLK